MGKAMIHSIFQNLRFRLQVRHQFVPGVSRYSPYKKTLVSIGRRLPLKEKCWMKVLEVLAELGWIKSWGHPVEGGGFGSF